MAVGSTKSSSYRITNSPMKSPSDSGHPIRQLNEILTQGLRRIKRIVRLTSLLPKEKIGAILATTCDLQNATGLTATSLLSQIISFIDRLITPNNKKHKQGLITSSRKVEEIGTRLGELEINGINDPRLLCEFSSLKSSVSFLRNALKKITKKFTYTT